MSKFAKLPLALLAVLAMLFLMPGLARAEDAAPPTAGQQVAGSPADAVVPNAVTDGLPPCPDLAHVEGCIIPCTVEPFTSSPLCPTTTPPPPGACEEVTDLPNCVPDCAFLAHLLDQDICTTLPQCLEPGTLPPDFPAIPGVPLCSAGGTPPPPSTPPESGGVYYKNCADARAHGATNIHRGQPGYRPALDRDHDGIACETSTSTETPPTPKAPTPKAPAPAPEPAPAPAPKALATPVVDQLAYTGAVPAPITVAGFGFLLGGAALLRVSRRTR